VPSCLMPVGHFATGATPSHEEDKDMSDQTTPITPDQAKVILQFLQRTQLTGSEMPAYVAVFNSLTAIVDAEPAPDAAAQAD